MQEDAYSSDRHSYKNKSVSPENAALSAQTAFVSTSDLTESSASRGSWYRSEHCEGLNVRNPSPSLKFRATSDSSALTTNAQAWIANEALASRNLITAEESRHFWSIRISLNRSERIFADSMQDLGIKESVYWATRFQLDFVRPLEILATLRGAMIVA